MGTGALPTRVLEFDPVAGGTEDGSYLTLRASCCKIKEGV